MLLTVERNVPDIFISDTEKKSGKICTAIPSSKLNPSCAFVIIAQPARFDAPNYSENIG